MCGGALGRIEELDPDFGMFIRLAATTDARRSQLCALRWSDVDLAGSTVTFARGFVDGGPGVGLVEKPTKTGQIWKVALAPGTANRLDDFRAVCEERAKTVRVELPVDAFVFAVPADGSRPWRPDNVTARWRRLRTKVGLDGCRMHDLRHYVATQLLGAGADPSTVVGRLATPTPTSPWRSTATSSPRRTEPPPTSSTELDEHANRSACLCQPEGMSEVVDVPGSDDVIALVDYLNEPGIHSNLARVRPDGSEVWRATPPGPEPDAWTEVKLEQRSVIARSWTDFFVEFELESGAEVSKRFVGKSESL